MPLRECRLLVAGRVRGYFGSEADVGSIAAAGRSMRSLLWTEDVMATNEAGPMRLESSSCL